MLLFTLQFTGQLLITKNYLAENVSSAEIEKLYCKTMIHALSLCSLFLVQNHSSITHKFLTNFKCTIKNSLY